MRQPEADRESAAAWRHASQSVLIACAMVLTAAGIAHGETPRQDVETAQPPDSEALQFIAQAAAKPATRDSLFEDDAPAADKRESKPASRDSLFDDAAPTGDKPQPGSAWKGFIQGEVARAYRDPEHWSKARLR